MSDKLVLGSDSVNTAERAYVETGDHIPIHGSDRATFKRCRQAWEFSAPSRYNLVPKIKYGGVSFPLWFGSLVHRALEEKYHPTLQRDPLEVFETVYYNGHYDNKLRLQIPGIDYIQTKNPDFWDLNHEEFEHHRELGLAMLTYYAEWCPPHDEAFEVLSVEQDFAIEMGEAVDVRDGVLKPILYKGRMDAVVQDKRTGQLSIIDHKTTASIADDYFAKLDLDEQVTSYIWAATKALGLNVGEIKGVWYNVLRKAAPTPPTVNKNGTLSIARATESTTPTLFMEAVSEFGLEEWFRTNDKVRAYYDYLVEMGDSQFIQRHWVPRNAYEINFFESQLRDELHDMTQNPKLYRNPSGDFMCTKCAFRSPCIAKGDGSDWEYMLRENYERNSDR